MAVSRLALAVDEGLATITDDMAVWGVRVGHEIDLLPRAARLIVRHQPDHDLLADQGWTVQTSAPDRAGQGLVFLPRSKAEARDMLAEAVSVATGPVLVDGQKTDGIESILRALKGRAEISGHLSKHHGKLAVIAPGADLRDWRLGDAEQTAEGYWTAPGVFSADGADPGSRLLVEALPPKLGASVLDLGAGWGYLASAVLSRPGIERIDLVEADLRALDCARQNVADARAGFHWADATGFASVVRYDCILCNPPFHHGRTAEPAIGQAFIRATARLLAPKGQLWLVANRHLPYETHLSTAFGAVEEVGGDRSYKLFRAARPRKEFRSP